MSLQPGCMVRTICGQLVTSCLHLGRFFLLPPHPPPHPPLPSPHPTFPSPPPSHPPPHNTGLKLMYTIEKNRLKRPKIKQGTTSKVNCILFNRLLSKVLLNKSGLVRAKAGSFTLKTLNGCFSNYYQVRTWPVFAGRVTYVTVSAKTSHVRTKI